MIILLNESIKSDITQMLINKGFNIRGCKLDDNSNLDSFILRSSDNSYPYKELAYDSYSKIYTIKFYEEKDDGNDFEVHTLDYKEDNDLDMRNCVIDWNRLR